MGIEPKTLIEDTCRQFERNFAAGDHRPGRGVAVIPLKVRGI